METLTATPLSAAAEALCPGSPSWMQPLAAPSESGGASATHAQTLADVKPQERADAGASGSGGQVADDQTPAPKPQAAAPIVASSERNPLNISAKSWPRPLGPAAFHGPVGELVKMIEPHTEADLAGVQVQLLACLGSYDCEQCGKSHAYSSKRGYRCPACGRTTRAHLPRVLMPAALLDPKAEWADKRTRERDELLVQKIRRTKCMHAAVR